MTNPSVKLNRCLTLLVQEGSAAGTVIIATNKRAKSSSKEAPGRRPTCPGVLVLRKELEEGRDRVTGPR